ALKCRMPDSNSHEVELVSCRYRESHDRSVCLRVHVTAAGLIKMKGEFISGFRVVMRSRMLSKGISLPSELQRLRPPFFSEMIVVKLDKFVNKVAGSQGIGEFIDDYPYAAANSGSRSRTP